MDILDIDEALKDDSFIFLEDKTHDDVSNILQQWKSNNCLPSQLQQQQQEQQQPHQQQQQPHQQQEQVYKLNSRTFTRPKRKLAHNLESQFFNSSYTNGGAQNYQNQQQHQQQQNGVLMLNLEIGGLVTTMHKSFLQDTSPPSSICSSMDVSIDGGGVGGGGGGRAMNNSLITSADFSNINFLQSTQSLDFNDRTIDGGFFNLTDKATSDGYTLNDMIRDREALESLTMSGDGTLIKDSHIAQIDDISLALSKTASGCSTMDNSTDSVEGSGINNRTVELANGVNRTYDGGAAATLEEVEERNVMAKAELATDDDIMHRTMLLSNEMIGDTTFNLIENSMCVQQEKAAEVDTDTCSELVVLNLTHDIAAAVATAALDETFKKPSPLNETVCLSAGKIGGGGTNTTFDCKTPDARCETPENTAERQAVSKKFYESTPQTSNVHRQNNNNKMQYTPSIKIVEDVNISPIVAPSHARVFNETFEQLQKSASTVAAASAPCNTTTTTTTDISRNTKLNTDTFCGVLPHFEESLELLENIEEPNETFNKNSYQHQQQRLELEQSAAGIEMQNVMDLAQAEAELLADCDNYAGDEEQFEHMLDEFGRVEVSAEQLKMRQSLDTIKKRFNYGVCIGAGGGGVALGGSKSAGEREISREARDMRELMHTSAPEEQQGASEAATGAPVTETSRPNLNATMELRNEELRKMRESMRELRELKAVPKEAVPSELRSTTASMLNSKDSIKELRESSAQGLTSVTNSASNGHERLLSRRSRLYDDINLSTLSAATASIKTPSSEDAAGPESKAETDRSGQATTPEDKASLAEGLKTEQELEAKCATADDTAAYKLAEKRERDRDRFKTIKIIKPRVVAAAADGAVGSGGESGTELNVPCIDDDDFAAAVNVEQAAAAASPQQTQRYSRRDEHVSPPAPNVFNNNKSEVEVPPRSKTNTNYLTYKKPKDKTEMPQQQQQRLNLPEAPPLLPSQADAAASQKSRFEPRSLSRPRFISGLQKFSVVSKATSAGDLEKTTTTANNSHGAIAALQQFNASKAASATSNSFNRTQPIVVADKVYGGGGGSDLKSPMGIKSKSFHNLSSNFGYAAGGGGLPAPKANTFGLRRLNNTSGSGGILTEKQAKANPMRVNSTAINTVANASKSEDSVFKVPKLVSGIRAPGPAGAAKRAGLMRPSSGYFSLNVMAKAGTGTQANDADSDTGRQSPTEESISSASSRSSVQSGCTGLKSQNSNHNLPLSELNLTKITTGSTGIPKPSGLRPPSNIKRSGLPRPASLVRR